MLLMPCTDKNVLGSDYDTPLDAAQGSGRLEFTCLLLERDTMSTAWVVPLASEHLFHALRCINVPNLKGIVCLSALGTCTLYHSKN